MGFSSLEKLEGELAPHIKLKILCVHSIYLLLREKILDNEKNTNLHSVNVYRHGKNI